MTVSTRFRVTAAALVALAAAVPASALAATHPKPAATHPKVAATHPKPAATHPKVAATHSKRAANHSKMAATHSKLPAITGFSPGAGKAMAKIVVVGRNFAGVKSVKVDGRIAKFKVDTAKKLTVTIPAKAKSGKIAVVTAHGTAKSAHALTIRA